MDENARILVTGATGFIGRFLLAELGGRGYTGITALARRTSDTGFPESMGIKIAFADITDRASLGAITGRTTSSGAFCGR